MHCSARSSSPVPNLGRIVVIGERFWRKVPRVGVNVKWGRRCRGRGRRLRPGPQSLQVPPRRPFRPPGPSPLTSSAGRRQSRGGPGGAPRPRSSARRPRARRAPEPGRNAPSRPRPPRPSSRPPKSPTSAGPGRHGDQSRPGPALAPVPAPDVGARSAGGAPGLPPAEREGRSAGESGAADAGAEPRSPFARFQPAPARRPVRAPVRRAWQRGPAWSWRMARGTCSAGRSGVGFDSEIGGHAGQGRQVSPW